eukprot:40859-Chlamydomonas_euryale.AAC.1
MRAAESGADILEAVMASADSPAAARARPGGGVDADSDDGAQPPSASSVGSGFFTGVLPMRRSSGAGGGGGGGAREDASVRALREALAVALGQEAAAQLIGVRGSADGGVEALAVARRVHDLWLRNRQLEVELSELEKEVWRVKGVEGVVDCGRL